MTVLLGCTGGGSSRSTIATTTTSPPATTAPAPTTIPTLSDTISLERAVVGGGAGGGHTVLTAAAAMPDGSALVAGRIERPATGAVSPLVLEPRGSSWRSRSLPLEGNASGEVSSVAAGPGGAIAAGTVRTATDHVAPASWVRIGRRWNGPFLAGDGAADTASVSAVAAGPAGAVLVGSEGDQASVWLSADGRLWNAAPPEWDAAKDADAVAVGDVVVMVAHEYDGGLLEPTVHVGEIGGPLERIGQPFGPPGTVVIGDLAATANGFIAVGGVSPEAGADYEPAVWLSGDGRSWTRSTGAIPSLGAPGGNLGTTLDLVDAGPEGVVVASDSGRVWRSPDGGQTFAALPATTSQELVVAVAADGEPLLASSSRVSVLSGETWTEPASGLLRVSQRTTMVNGITNFDGAWYAVGVRTGLDAGEPVSSGLVWRSPDGRRWELVAGGGALEGLSLAAVTAADGWLVAVGTGIDGAKDGVGQILRSRDGVRWRSVSSPDLTAPAGGTHQLESVAPGPDAGAAATGVGFDGVDIQPLVLRLGADAEVDRSERGLDVASGDVVTLAVCTSGDTSLLVGQAQGASLTAQGWTSSNIRRWREVELPQLATARSCSGSRDGRFTVAGVVATATGFAPAAIAGTPDAFTPIPIAAANGGPNDVAMGNDVVVIGGVRQSDGALWIGDDQALEPITAAGMAGPGSQSVEAVAIAGGQLIIAGQVLGEAAIWVAELP